MGIKDLLPNLRPIERPVSLENFRGKTLAIDGYAWLHKGAFSCAQDLCLGKPTQKFVNFCMERVGLLKSFGVVPYIVLDGGHLPMKQATEKEREKKRNENLEKAKKFLEEGKKSEAFKCFQICLDITPAIALELIKKLRMENIQYVVAPYEADAQMAYLEKEGIVDGIITEDSDLLVFGCKQVIYKLDKYGQGICLSSDDVGKVEGPLDLRGWSFSTFRQMCIMSGCDYLESLPGIGMKTAYTQLKKFKTFDRFIRVARSSRTDIPADYETRFLQAEMTFLHQRVFDPRSKQMVFMSPVLDSKLLDDFGSDFLGPEMDAETALFISTGELDPISRKRLIDFSAIEILKPSDKIISKFFNPIGPRFSVVAKDELQATLPSGPFIHASSVSSRLTLKRNRSFDGTKLLPFSSQFKTHLLKNQVKHEQFKDVLDETGDLEPHDDKENQLIRLCKELKENHDLKQENIEAQVSKSQPTPTIYDSIETLDESRPSHISVRKQSGLPKPSKPLLKSFNGLISSSNKFASFAHKA